MNSVKLGWRSATLHWKPSRLRWLRVTTAAELGSNCLWTPSFTRVLIANTGGCWQMMHRLFPLMYNGADYCRCTNNQRLSGSKGKNLTSELFLLLQGPTGDPELSNLRDWVRNGNKRTEDGWQRDNGRRRGGQLPYREGRSSR